MLQKLKPLPKKNETPQEIKAFSQHGFVYIPENKSGNQVFGVCPFCGHKEHKHQFTFYINTETHAWDCKSCGRQGGFQGFLQEIVDFSIKNFTGAKAQELITKRGLPLEVFQKWKVGWNPASKRWIIPVYDRTQSNLWQVYYYNGKDIRGTTTCKPSLYGWDNLHDGVQKIFLCEGEWDTMAMQDVIERKGFQDTECAMGVNSASTFKPEWTQFFVDKEVVVIYDNDDAGKGSVNKDGIAKGGCIKVQTMLATIVRDIRYVNWPGSYKKGFDLNDLYKKFNGDALKIYRCVGMFTKVTPPEVELPEGVEVRGKAPAIKLDGRLISREEVYQEYGKHLTLKDPYCLDVLFGTAIGNRIPGDPLWLYLIAPPSGTKSELIMSIDQAPLITAVTSMTPHTLISGSTSSGGQDPSLIPALDGKVLVVKDFTAMLKLPIVERNIIFGTLRDAYDGKIDKPYGTGLFRRYESTFGIIAGCTHAIDMELEDESSLGERFLRYKLPDWEDMTEQIDLIKSTLGSVGYEKRSRQSLKDVGKAVLSFKYDITPENLPRMDQSMEDRLAHLGFYVAKMRAYVPRDRYTGDITHKAYAEVGIRLTKQFYKMAMGIALFRQESFITEEVFNIMRKVAIDTTPTRNEHMLRAIWGTPVNHGITSKELEDKVHLPNMTIKRILGNLAHLEALGRWLPPRKKMKGTSKLVSGGAERYYINPWLQNIIEHTNLYEGRYILDHVEEIDEAAENEVVRNTLRQFGVTRKASSGKLIAEKGNGETKKFKKLKPLQ